QSRPRILHRSAALSTVYFEEFSDQIFEYFQTVAFVWEVAVSGLSLRSDAHSTGATKTVNALFRKTFPLFGFHLCH
ncbi:hypothetical protein, partial [Marinobacter sp. NSM]|uniref:hypothetical protein n=1 Tax=Marinobacter sp. NSM TaxID=3458004 RepID=UPI0040355F06